MYADVTGPGRELCERFKALSDMTGKTVDEIVASVGSPTSRSAMAHGQVLLQWQATGYHVALLFNAEGRMVGITHESAHFYDAPRGCLGVVALVAVVILAVLAVITALQL
ncbi:MAG: hypothetical protein WCF68_04125 [Terriglobales bacterium]